MNRLPSETDYDFDSRDFMLVLTSDAAVSKCNVTGFAVLIDGFAYQDLGYISDTAVRTFGHGRA